jgi:hypothetical protein
LVFQIQVRGRLFSIDTFSVQHETERGGLDTLLDGIAFKDFGKLGAALDFEKGLFSRLQEKKAV